MSLPVKFRIVVARAAMPRDETTEVALPACFKFAGYGFMRKNSADCFRLVTT
jgi:hypothetical protein